jgi:SAM-dependent methyltransferase
MFEYSYRTVEKVGFAALLGFRIAVQEIRQPSWWRDEPHAWLQVVPLDGRYLPYTEGFADLAFTDGAIFDFERDALQAFFLECLRVLKPGGCFIIWAGNSRSRSRARSETRWHGRIHSLPEVRTAAIDAGFLEVDCSFEGFSPPFFATVVNMLRLALGPWPIKTYDYDSWLAQWQRPERRAYWLLRLEKPALRASRSAV